MIPQKTDLILQGSKVRLTQGTLEGLEGQVVTTQPDKLIVAISDSPGVYVAVSPHRVESLDMAAVEPWLNSCEVTVG
jgi:ribosomal protein L24